MMGKESALLKAIESLGRIIESLELDIYLKDMRIEELERKLKERSEGRAED